MKLHGVALCIFACCIPAFPFVQPTAVDVAEALGKISVDPQRTYHVRVLQITRGDIKIYLTDGTLGFATPIAGRVVAAVFPVGFS